MSDDRWMVRGAERQNFLNRHQDSLFRLEDTVNGQSMGKGDVHFLFFLTAMMFFQEIESRQGRIPDGKIIEAKKEFVRNFLKEVKDFSRTPEEELALILDMTKKILDTALSPIYGALQTAELFNGDKIFGKPNKEVTPA